MIGKKIKEIRMNSSMSQKDFAKSIGLSQASLSKVEKGKQKANIDTLSKISEVYKVDLEELIAEENDNLDGELISKDINIEYDCDHDFKHLEVGFFSRRKGDKRIVERVDYYFCSKCLKYQRTIRTAEVGIHGRKDLPLWYKMRG